MLVLLYATASTEYTIVTMAAQKVITHIGGYVYKVDDLSRLTRFLCLGAEGGTYYVTEQELKRENVQCITRLIEAGRGNEVVQTLVDFSVSGRTAKQNGLMFAMAMCARQSVDPGAWGPNLPKL